MDYVELHCHSHFSLLDGASAPEDLVCRARQAGMPALALTDHDGLYGAIQFYKAARQAGVKPVIGTEITLDGGHHVTLLAKTNRGYSNLCRLLTKAHMGRTKGDPSTDFATLADHSGDIICLSGCKKGEIPSLLKGDKKEEARAAARKYQGVFGKDFFIELQHNLCPGDTDTVRHSVELADELGIDHVATNNVHYATPDKYRLHDVLVCIKNTIALDQSGHLLRPNAEFYLKPAREMAALLQAYPQALQNTLRIADRCSVDLDFSSYRFPEFPVPDGENTDSYLAKLCWNKARERYPDLTAEVSDHIDYELRLIAKLGLSGYFLIVWDIMDYARRNRIPAQGRGSAANSIIAYILGITRVDVIKHKLFVGRFINEDMASIPDIDIDVSTNHREQLIQYVYQKYGAEHTAMVCTYVTFQARNAIREVGKVLGMPEGIIDQMAKTVGAYSARDIGDDLGGLEKFRPYVNAASWQQFISLCGQIADLPRHLSIHVGGMLISSRPLNEIVPLEPAAMPGRVVCQWDKDGVGDAGLLKVDILGLRMLSLIDEVVSLVRQVDPDFRLDRIPLNDSRVYDMICRADTLGVFQVESRAQMQTLPRTRPRTIEDLTVEVAIIRPGPLQGNMVNPYINRRRGREAVSYPHPSLQPILEETLGVILFQEQVLQVAIVIAGFTAGEADALRRAMSRKRSQQAIEGMRQRFLDGARQNSISDEVANQVFNALKGFAEYGFCKSHAAGFALLAYESAWLKTYYPPQFYSALLNNQPMGFYSPEVIIGDAKRHGLRVLPVDINHSRGDCTVESGQIRLGFRYVKEMGETAISDLEKARMNGDFTSLQDFYQRTKLSRDVIENLILAGALDCFGIPRRQQFWETRVLENIGRDSLSLGYTSFQMPMAQMTDWEEMALEYDLQGLSARQHPMELIRQQLPQGSVLSGLNAMSVPSGSRVRTAGYVVCRQAPGTAKGHVFLTIEDETGLTNVVVRPDVYQKFRYVIRTEPLVLIDGIMQKREGISNIIAVRISPLRKTESESETPCGTPAPATRSFR